MKYGWGLAYLISIYLDLLVYQISKRFMILIILYIKWTILAKYYQNRFVWKMWKKCEKSVKNVKKMWKKYEKCEKNVKKFWKMWKICEKYVKNMWKKCEKYVKKMWKKCEKKILAKCDKKDIILEKFGKIKKKITRIKNIIIVYCKQ